MLIGQRFHIFNYIRRMVTGVISLISIYTMLSLSHYRITIILIAGQVVLTEVIFFSISSIVNLFFLVFASGFQILLLTHWTEDVLILCLIVKFLNNKTEDTVEAI